MRRRSVGPLPPPGPGVCVVRVGVQVVVIIVIVVVIVVVIIVIVVVDTDVIDNVDHNGEGGSEEAQEAEYVERIGLAVSVLRPSRS